MKQNLTKEEVEVLTVEQFKEYLAQNTRSAILALRRGWFDINKLEEEYVCSVIDDLINKVNLLDKNTVEGADAADVLNCFIGILLTLAKFSIENLRKYKDLLLNEAEYNKDDAELTEEDLDSFGDMYRGPLGWYDSWNQFYIGYNQLENYKKMVEDKWFTN